MVSWKSEKVHYLIEDVVAHLYGIPGKIAEIKAIAAKYGAVIVEDVAESLGATYKG